MQGVSNTVGVSRQGCSRFRQSNHQSDVLKFQILVLGVIMAVQQNKKSPSKRGMHRAHDFLVAPPIAVEPTTGETHRRHHISPNGFYRGRKVLKTKNDE
jgi:large subunit ribosomal protein L32